MLKGYSPIILVAVSLGALVSAPAIPGIIQITQSTLGLTEIMGGAGELNQVASRISTACGGEDATGSVNMGRNERILVEPNAVKLQRRPGESDEFSTHDENSTGCTVQNAQVVLDENDEYIVKSRDSGVRVVIE